MKRRIIVISLSLLVLIVPTLLSEVVINEVFYDPQGNDNDATNREFIELYNNGSDPVYIGRYKLQMAGPHWKTGYVIIPGTIIPAHSYLLIAEGETFGVIPDLVGSLELQNGNYQAYYDDQWHTFTGPVDGVRLTSPDGAVINDCLLYNDGDLGNENNLETTGAATDGFYEDVSSGSSISRLTAGADNNLLSDWETLSEPSPAARGALADSDGDGLPDVIEDYVGSNPNVVDTDGDDLEDGEEMDNGNLAIDNHETDPTDPDTDDDGLWDGLEVNTYYSQPRKPDTDGDGLEDGPEVNTHGTSPTKPDTDFDGYADNLELDYGTDPVVASSHPGVVINDVYYDHPGSDDRMEFITLYNPEVYDVDISYFRIESAGTEFRRNLAFPANTIIPADCFFLIGEEDAVDMNGNPPDLISWLALQNGDQNDPDAYYYGAESPTDGVRLTGPKVDSVAIVIDTVLWDSPNTNNLPGDAHDPAQSDEFIPDTDPGKSLRRKIVGYDTDNKSDWEEVIPIKVASTSGNDPDSDGLTNTEEAAWETNPYNPDTDNDGMGDGDEVWHGYNPKDPNSVPPSFADANIRKFPIKSGDFNGDGTLDISIFRPSVGLWAVKGVTRVYFGTSGDIPMPADYNGDGTSDITIFRRNVGLWAVRGLTRIYFGNQTDLPVPADYDGDGTGDIGFFRPSSGFWAIRGLTQVYFGTTGDVPVPADYGGGSSADEIAIFRPSTGLWAIRGVTRTYFGQSLDLPVPEDYNDNGCADIGIFRERPGLWAIRDVTRTYFGTVGDKPALAEWAPNNGIAIFRPSTGLWAIRDVIRTYFGQTNDIPMPMFYQAIDLDCDGLPDWWEEQYFNSLDHNPQNDYDLDGSSNLEEYLSGTNPTSNPNYIEPVFPPSSSSSDTVKYIIITNETLRDADVYPYFQTLIFHRLAQGMRGGIVTIEEIDAHAQYDGVRPDGGIDLQTKIRQFIRDAYDNWETDYVLLGGDEFVIPPRYFYVYVYGGMKYVPADLYYGCLFSAGTDTDFDYDQDGKYGETNDGPGGGEVDLLEEVSVGRAPVKDADDLENFITKTIDYENTTDTYLHKILYITLSYWRNYGDMIFWGRTDVKPDEVYTNGINKLSFFNKLESMYCTTGGPWEGQHILNQINEAADYNHMIIDSNHGGVFYGMGIHTIATGNTVNLGKLTNSKPFFAHVRGCKSGSYDYLVGPGKSLAAFNDYPYGLTIGDFNQGPDGHLDIAVSFKDADTVKLGYGNGNGTFSSFTKIAQSADGLDGPTWLIKDHFNSDSYWDFAVVNSEGTSFSILNSNGSGGYSVTTYNSLPENPNHLIAIDFDGDGDSDLAITTVSGSMGIYLYENNNGNFSYYDGMELPWDEIEEEAAYLTSGRFNSDNNADLAVTSDADKVYVIFGDGDGTFSEYTAYSVGLVPRYVCSGDFDKDGLDDLAVSCQGIYNPDIEHYESELWVWLNDADAPGTFSSQIYTERTELNYISAEADLNQDGYLDIIAPEKYDAAACGFSLFLGQPLGKFIPNRGGYGGVDQANCGAVGDIDEDGLLDIVVSKAKIYKKIFIAFSSERDCFTEELGNIEQGAFASIGAAFTNGGDYYAPEFVDAFSREYIDYFGEAFADSKEDNIGVGGVWRAHHYYLHFLGDPAVKIKFNRVPLILGNGDFDGDGTSDIATFRSNSGLWIMRNEPGISFGNQTDLPANGDYDGDGTADIAVFDKISARWSIRNLTAFTFGSPGSESLFYFRSSSDMPAPADYNGDGTTDVAVYRPSEGLWSIKDITSFTFGEHLDIPTVLDYNGDGSDDIAAFRPSTGEWLIRSLTTITFGTEGDQPVPADYNGDGTEEIAIYRPSANLWAIKDVTTCYFGDIETYYSIPVPADYTGDGTSNICTFDPATSNWIIRNVTTYHHGAYYDIPVSTRP